MSAVFQGAGVDEPHELHAVAQPSALADIESELAADVPQRTVTLDVPGRPGWSVRYAADVSSAELNGWRRAAKDDKSPDGVDGVRLACGALASKCRALLRHGTEVPESADDSSPRTFQSPSMKALYRTERNIDVAAAFYGGHARDADLEAAAAAVLLAAGWGGEANVADPTER